MQTKVLTAHVPLPLAQKIDNLAAQLDRPRAWIVKQALAAWVSEEEERHRLTLEGMADVTAGRVVDQSDVEAWVEAVLSEHAEAIVSVRGKDRFVVMDMAHYRHLRECELEAALAQTRADVTAGRFVEESPEAHLARLDKLA